MTVLWTLVLLSGAPVWQAPDGQTKQYIIAAAYPTGTEARTCEALTSSCRLYEDVEHVWVSGPAVGKTQAWQSGETLLPWFAASAYAVGDTVMVSTP
jgi:hypothetical protein